MILTDQMIQCQLCGLQMSNVNHCYSLIQHWKESHSGQRRRKANGVVASRYIQLLHHISQKNQREKHGINNKNLLECFKQFSKKSSLSKVEQFKFNLPVEDEKIPVRRFISRKFGVLLNHCSRRRQLHEESLKEISVFGNHPACNEVNLGHGSTSHGNEINQVKCEAKTAGASKINLQCIKCSRIFNNAVDAIRHHEEHKASTQPKMQNIKMNEYSGMHEEIIAIKKEKPSNAVNNMDQDAIGDKTIDIEEKALENTQCKDFKPSNTVESPDNNARIANATEVNAADENSNVNDRAIKEIISQSKIIKDYLSRNLFGEEDNCTDENKTKSVLDKKSESDTRGANEQYKTGEKQRSLRSEQERTLEEKRISKEKGREQKIANINEKFSVNSKKSECDVRCEEDVNTRKKKKIEIDTVEKSNSLKQATKNSSSPPTSLWEDLIWNSTKDPKCKKLIGHVVSDNKSLKGDVDEVTSSTPPKLARRQSARKSCVSKERNNVRKFSEEVSDCDRWPFSPEPMDRSCGDDIRSHPDDVADIFRFAAESVQERNLFSVRLSAIAKRRRLVHRKITKDGIEVSPNPISVEPELTDSMSQYHGTRRKRKQTARKSTRSRGQHQSVQDSNNPTTTSTQKETCECHMCGKIVSTSTKELYAHWTTECNK